MSEMMGIPSFPEWREITLEDKPVFDAAFAARPPEISAYAFTNVFAWREAREFRLSELGGRLLVWREVDGRIVFLEPIGGDPASAIISMAEIVESSIEVTRVHAHVAAQLRERPQLRAELDRDNSDYLYLASDLIDLPGRKFDAKRNFIRRFKSERDYEYVVMTQETADECREFAEIWCEERSCETVEGLRDERRAVHEMLVNFGALGLRGGAIRVDGAIVAFSLGEPLNPETLVVHVEKADSRIDGLYQLVNNEFCIHEARGFTYVNREQDLGVPGLRKAKESYHPATMVEAWKVSSEL